MFNFLEKPPKLECCIEIDDIDVTVFDFSEVIYGTIFQRSLKLVRYLVRGSGSEGEYHRILPWGSVGGYHRISSISLEYASLLAHQCVTIVQ